MSAWQMCRQCATADTAPGSTLLAALRITLLRLGTAACCGLLQRFEAELQLLLW